MHDKKKNGGCAVWSVLLHHRNHLVPSPIRPCDIQSHDLSSDLHNYYLSVGFFPTHFFSSVSLNRPSCPADDLTVKGLNGLEVRQFKSTLVR